MKQTYINKLKKLAEELNDIYAEMAEMIDEMISEGEDVGDLTDIEQDVYNSAVNIIVEVNKELRH